MTPPEKLRELARQIAVMQHYAKGGVIETRERYGPGQRPWCELTDPHWDWKHNDYRIAPIKKFIGVRLYRDAAGRVAAATDEEKMLIDAIEQEKHRWLSDWQALQITTPDN